ncbi:MAG: abortive infection family protein [Acidobacteriales bacterium]|nr:abortive infection family protein [Terriglobales bacterium]
MSYADSDDLPKLYRLTADVLNLSPSQHTEQMFRQILGSCQAIVEGLGAMRNRHSDAHGTGKAGVRPAPRHAELAVNLAGTMATFLLATWESKCK